MNLSFEFILFFFWSARLEAKKSLTKFGKNLIELVYIDLNFGRIYKLFLNFKIDILVYNPFTTS